MKNGILLLSCIFESKVQGVMHVLIGKYTGYQKPIGYHIGFVHRISKNPHDITLDLYTGYQKIHMISHWICTQDIV